MPSSSPTRPRRAYYVERTAVTKTTFLVFAASAAEAAEIAREGDGEPIDSLTYDGRYGRPRRAPAEDHDAVE